MNPTADATHSANTANAPSPKPAVVLAMKYPSSEGNVWAWVGGVYNRLGAELTQAGVRPIVAFPRIDNTTAFDTNHLEPVQRDLTRKGTDSDLAESQAWLIANNVKLVLYADIDAHDVNLKLMRKLGIRTLDYAHYNYPDGDLPPWPVRVLKQLRAAMGIFHHDIYIPVSEHNKSFLHAHGGIPLEKLRLVVNGIDTDKFNPGSAISQRPDPALWQLPVSDHYVMTVSQARPEKRVDFLIDAANVLFKKRPNASVTFVYVGDGELLETWKQKAAALGLAERFIFLGQRKDVQSLLQLGTIGVQPSERESFGLAMIEAMASGLPMLCTDIRATRESMIQDQTGYLLKLNDPEVWADKLLGLMDDEALRVRLGQGGRARVEERFSIRRQVRELRDILLEHLKR